MDDPVLNCVLSVCCDAANAEDAFATALHDGLQLGSGSGAAPMDLTPRQCTAVACWVYEHFDLAEKGTLKPLKDSIARLARG